MNHALGHIHSGVQGFYEKYFPSLLEIEQALQAQQEDSFLPGQGNLLSKPSTFAHSALTGQSNLFEWLMLQRGRMSNKWDWCISSSSNKEGDQIHLLRLLPKGQVPSTESKTATITQAVGCCHDHKFPKPYGASLDDLCFQVQRVFELQPARLYVHGFLIHGSTFTSWVFDRSGIYCPRAIPFHPETGAVNAVAILDSYRLMSTVQLGCNLTVSMRDNGQYLRLSEDNSKVELRLDDTPSFSSGEIVGSGLSVFRAKHNSSPSWEFAVKFKWIVPGSISTVWPGEMKMLKLVTDRNVWGVIHLFDYQAMGSTEHLREGLQFDRTSTLQAGKKATSTQWSSYTAKAQDDQRALQCTVIQPLGKPLDAFASITQLLEAIRDAIKAHWSLYQNNILHQDISVWNIMIPETRPLEPDGPRGILVDLDLAMELEDILPDGRTRAGTPMFMAVGVLRCKHHTYRHDLESFLYVLVWMVICRRCGPPLEGSLLERWRGDDVEKLGMVKEHDMRDDGFEAILEEFDAEFEGVKPLARSLRRILFCRKDLPGGESSLFFGTDGSEAGTHELYNAMLRAFDESLSSLS